MEDIEQALEQPAKEKTVNKGVPSNEVYQRVGESCVCSSPGGAKNNKKASPKGEAFLVLVQELVTSCEQPADSSPSSTRACRLVVRTERVLPCHSGRRSRSASRAGRDRIRLHRQIRRSHRQSHRTSGILRRHPGCCVVQRDTSGSASGLDSPGPRETPGRPR